MNLRRVYLDLASRLPPSWRVRLDKLPLPFFGWLDRRRTLAAIRSGPPYRPSHDRIVIDLTTACDLGCVDCNRSCGPNQAPAQQHLGMDQLAAFIADSIASGRRWRVIQLEGGEPTLHPRFHAMVAALDDYRRRHAPTTVIKVIANGFGEASRQALAKLPPSVDVFVSRKTEITQPSHCAFNVAPVDQQEFAGADFSRGCFLPAREGLGLTFHGYYPHPVCGGIDRVFGFGIGRASLPLPSDDLRDQFARLCPLCGLFRFFSSLDRRRPCLVPDGRELALRGSQSPSWTRAYARYRREPR